MATQTYTIQINELQRQIIAGALAIVATKPKLFATEQEELTLLVGMFTDLPEDEAEDPGCTHCFNL